MADVFYHGARHQLKKKNDVSPREVVLAVLAGDLKARDSKRQLALRGSR
jgi:hypothetical protein